MGNIFLSGQNQCHITGVKKSYFCHTFHLRPKKVFWWVVGGGGGWWWWVKSDFSVSLCPFSYFYRHTDTEMDTELDKNKNKMGG